MHRVRDLLQGDVKLPALDLGGDARESRTQVAG